LTPLNGTTFLPAATNVLGDNIYYTDLNIKAHSYAAFAQTDWKFVPTWKLTTGIRYNYDEESGPEQTRLLLFLPNVVPFAVDITDGSPAFGIPPPIYNPQQPNIPLPPGVVSRPTLDPATGNWVRQLQASWNAVTGTAGLEWTPNDNVLGYFKYSRGYKAGGLNAGSIVAVPETNPEFLNAYEIGAKWSTRKFQINEAIYFYDYQGLQIPLSVQPPTGPAISEVFNIPKVLSYGSESEILFRPIADWAFLLNYTYMRSYIDTNFNAVDAVQQELVGAANYTAPNLNGSTVPFSPRNKIAANTNYTWHFAPGFLNFSASWVYKAATYGSIFNTAYNLAPSYTTLDFRTTWTDVDDRYTVFLFCHNCGNKIAYDGITSGAAINAPFLPNSITQTPGLIPPRQYGVQLEWRPKFK
jgi:iron complex outermembrane receptor protein